MSQPNLTQTDPTVDRSASASDGPPRLQLDRGAAVGRYVILDLVGEGGMGVVYAAYDPELDRKLALKLLRTASSDRRGERRRVRLIREAQAMARLSHRNVITVHDVGTIDDQVFVAMEFIDGCSLGEWIRRGHEWRRVIEVFTQAGHGLAAAHAAGLVHRDFKPDNVMLTTEQRAVVTDFGLARASGRGPASASRDPESVSASRAPLSTTVTAAGAIMGTPAYMPPEQHEGREVDARSDQFAFAVALYEALYGQRPFPGDDVASLAYNVGVGNVRPAPSRTTVPGWIRAVLLRALSVEPEARYPSMSALLHALETDRGAGDRRWRWAVGAVVLCGGVATAGYVLEEQEEPCRAGAVRVADALGEGPRAEVVAAFERSALPFARETLPAVSQAVAGYAEQWATSYAVVCEATHVRHEQSGALFDGRMACLNRRLADASALLDLLATGEPRALERALDAVTSLPPPAGCESSHTDGWVRASADAARARALRPKLARVAALERTGMFTIGLDAARSLVDETLELDDPPLQAEARLRLASLQRVAGQHELAEFNYKEALSLALRVGGDEVAAEAAVALVGLTGRDAARAREAESWSGVAAALLARSDAPAVDRAGLLARRAELLQAAGRLDAAQRPLRDAVELLEESYGAADVRVAEAHASLGRLLVDADDPVRAEPLLRRALEVIEDNLGVDHPRAASLMHLLGKVQLASGDLEAARQYLRGALAVRKQQRDATPHAETLLLLATLETVGGHLDTAEELLREAAALEGQSVQTRGDAVVAFARVALRRGDVSTALDRVAAGRKVVGEGSGALHRCALDAVVADTLLRRGELAKASTLLEATVRTLEGRGEAEAHALATPLTLRGELLLAREQPARALGALERALSLRSSTDPHGRARTEFALASALSQVDADSTRSVELAQQARARLVPSDPLRQRVERWLEGHGAG